MGRTQNCGETRIELRGGRQPSHLQRFSINQYCPLWPLPPGFATAIIADATGVHLRSCSPRRVDINAMLQILPGATELERVTLRAGEWVGRQPILWDHLRHSLCRCDAGALGAARTNTWMNCRTQREAPTLQACPGCHLGVDREEKLHHA